MTDASRPPPPHWSINNDEKHIQSARTLSGEMASGGAMLNTEQLLGFEKIVVKDGCSRRVSRKELRPRDKLCHQARTKIENEPFDIIENSFRRRKSRRS